MTESESARRTVLAKPIDQGTLGRTPLLNQDDLLEVLTATGLKLKKDVDQTQFLYWLNNIVERTVREQLSARLDQRTIAKLKKSIETYTEVSRSLLHSEFPPPVPPLEWLREVHEWIGKAESDLSDRSSGGAPKNVEQLEFLPRALGLFHAGFGVVPDNTVSWIAGDRRGAAFRFVHTVSCRVRDRIRERGFSDEVDLELRGKARWVVISDDAIRKRIEAALEYQSDAGELSIEVDCSSDVDEPKPMLRMHRDSTWRIESNFFRGFIRNS